MKLLLKLILVALATFSVLVCLRTLGQMIHPGATHYWVAQPTVSSGSGWTDPDCGSPPVSAGLVQWLCSQSFHGLSDNTLITNWPDISPVGANGLYFTNMFGSSTKPAYRTSGQNGMPFLTMGTAIIYSPMANSNAWWSGVTEAQIFYVLLFTNNVNESGIETLGSSGVDEMLYSSSGGNIARLGFGSTVRKDIAVNFKQCGFIRLSIWTKANDWGVLSNNVTVFSTNVNTVGWPATTGQGLIGFSMPSGWQAVFDLYEVLVFTNKLSEAQNTSMDNWLKTKYGL